MSMDISGAPLDNKIYVDKRLALEASAAIYPVELCIGILNDVVQGKEAMVGLDVVFFKAVQTHLEKARQCSTEKYGR